MTATNPTSTDTAAATLPQLVLRAADRHRGPATRVRREGALLDTTFADLGTAPRGRSPAG